MHTVAMHTMLVCHGRVPRVSSRSQNHHNLVPDSLGDTG